MAKSLRGVPNIIRSITLLFNFFSLFTSLLFHRGIIYVAPACTVQKTRERREESDNKRWTNLKLEAQLVLIAIERRKSKKFVLSSPGTS